jgi:hypothetical protein
MKTRTPRFLNTCSRNEFISWKRSMDRRSRHRRMIWRSQDESSHKRHDGALQEDSLLRPDTVKYPTYVCHLSGFLQSLWPSPTQVPAHRFLEASSDWCLLQPSGQRCRCPLYAQHLVGTGRCWNCDTILLIYLRLKAQPRVII